MEFKCYYYEQGVDVDPIIRILSADFKFCDDHINEFLGQIQKGFGFYSMNDVHVAWKDHEGDLISFSTEEELQVAINRSTRKPDDILRIVIKHKDVKPDASATSSNASKERHPNVVCDVCDQEIYGSRFKCMVCLDYDLCSKCEVNEVHENHPMIRFRVPAPAPFSMFNSNMFSSFPFPGAAGRGTGPHSMFNDKDFLHHVGSAVSSLLDPYGIDVDVRVDDKVPQAETSQKQVAPWEMKVPEDGLVENTRLIVNGTFPEDGHSFALDLINGENILFHFNPRFTEQCIVRNSFFGGWGYEEREGPSLALIRGKPFQVIIDVKKNSYELTLNGCRYPSYVHRAPFENVRAVRVRSPYGPLVVHDIKFYNQNTMDQNEAELASDVNKVSMEDKEMEANKSSTQNYSFDSVYPKLETPTPIPAHVSDALKEMLNMGFDNTGGWLLKLLESTNGDIGKALDRIHPMYNFGTK